jgi:hypothetical protein
MAWEAGGGVDLSVDLVLVQIVSPVRHGSRGLVLELIARFYLFLVRVAISAERLDMTDVARLFLLPRIEFMLRDVIRAVIERRFPVSVAITAERHGRDINRMLFRNAVGGGTGEEHHAEYHGESNNHDHFEGFVHILIS